MGDVKVALQQVELSDLPLKQQRHGDGYVWIKVHRPQQVHNGGTLPAQDLALFGLRAEGDTLMVHMDVYMWGPQSARLVRKAMDALRATFEVNKSDTPIARIMVASDTDLGEKHSKFMTFMGLNPMRRLYISTTPIRRDSGA